MVSGSLSLPARGASHLSLTVLVHYRSPACIQPFGMVPDNSGGIPRVPPYSGAGLTVREVFAYGAFTLRGAAFQHASANLPAPPRRRSYYPEGAETPAVWAAPPSLAATDGIIIIFFSCGYLDVSVPRVRLHLQCMARRRRAGFPHSDIRGSQGICPSPRLFAACHVLLRHPEPRHPPCALFCFPFFLYRYMSLSSCPAGDPLVGVPGGRSVLFSASSMSMCFWWRITDSNR